MASSRFQVIVPANPKAVVLLYGWFGAQAKHVAKYSQLYSQCATIAGVCPPLETILKLDDKIQAFVKSSLAELDALDKNLPLMVHCFSNGGGFCMEHLHRLLEQDERTIAVEIYDSAPAHISADTFVRVLSSSISNESILYQAVSLFAKGAFYVAHSWTKLVGAKWSPTEYWNAMLNHSTKAHQAFVYSSADSITDSRKLDEFVEHRKQHTMGNVTILKFDDTEHCQHLMKHSDEYQQLINRMIEKAVK